jgi:hypothetical protein
MQRLGPVIGDDVGRFIDAIVAASHIRGDTRNHEYLPTDATSGCGVSRMRGVRMSTNGSPTVVLVHGAFADASGFRGLYDELLGQAAKLVDPPNPLRGLMGGDGDYLKAAVGEID